MKFEKDTPKGICILYAMFMVYDRQMDGQTKNSMSLFYWCREYKYTVYGFSSHHSHFNFSSHSWISWPLNLSFSPLPGTSWGADNFCWISSGGCQAMSSRGGQKYTKPGAQGSLFKNRSLTSSSTCRIWS